MLVKIANSRMLPFLGAITSSFLYQLVVLIALSFVEGLMAVFFGGFYWDISDRHLMGVRQITGLAIFAVILALCYAIAWLGFWWLVRGSRKSTSWFGWRIASAILPFLLGLMTFRPTPDPMQMIPTSPAELRFIFSCMVTGMCLFPVYSWLVDRSILSRHRPIIGRTFATWLLLLPLTAGLWVAAWHMMPVVYHVNS